MRPAVVGIKRRILEQLASCESGTGLPYGDGTRREVSALVRLGFVETLSAGPLSVASITADGREALAEPAA